MATPVVSGSLAVLLDKNRNLGPQQLKTEIINSCNNLDERAENQGAGIIDLENLFKPIREESPRPTPPNMPRRRSRNRYQPNMNIEKREGVDRQDSSAGSLVFMLFLILLFIRVI